MSFIYNKKRYEVRRIALSTHKKVYEKYYCFVALKSRNAGEFPSSISEGSRTSYSLVGLENK